MNSARRSRNQNCPRRRPRNRAQTLNRGRERGRKNLRGLRRFCEIVVRINTNHAEPAHHKSFAPSVSFRFFALADVAIPGHLARAGPEHQIKLTWSGAVAERSGDSAFPLFRVRITPEILARRDSFNPVSRQTRAEKATPLSGGGNEPPRRTVRAIPRSFPTRCTRRSRFYHSRALFGH